MNLSTNFTEFLNDNNNSSLLDQLDTKPAMIVRQMLHLENHPHYVYARNVYTWLVPVMVSILLVAIIGNGVIVLSAPWLHRPISPYHRLCLSLALADAWAASLLATGLIVNSYIPVVLRIPQTERCLNCILEIFRIAGMLTSNLHILALAIHQFVGIIYPLKYKMILTTRRQRVLVLLLWIVPILYIFIWFIANPNDGLRVPKCPYFFYNRLPFRLTVFTSFIIPLFATFALYAIILFTLLKAKAKCDHDFRKYMHHGYHRRVKSKLKLVWTTLLILSTFTLSWGVCVLYFVLVCKEGCVFIYMKSISFHFGFLLNSTVNFLVMVKLMLNPLIYALRMRHIRASVAALLSALCLRHFGRALTINQISMNFVTTTQLPDSEPNSRRASKYFSRMSSDKAIPIDPAQISLSNGDVSNLNWSRTTKNPKRSASIVGTTGIRNGFAVQGLPNPRNNTKLKLLSETDKWGNLLKNNRRTCV